MTKLNSLHSEGDSSFQLGCYTLCDCLDFCTCSQTRTDAKLKLNKGAVGCEQHELTIYGEWRLVVYV